MRSTETFIPSRLFWQQNGLGCLTSTKQLVAILRPTSEIFGPTFTLPSSGENFRSRRWGPRWRHWERGIRGRGLKKLFVGLIFTPPRICCVSRLTLFVIVIPIGRTVSRRCSIVSIGYRRLAPLHPARRRSGWSDF